MKIKDVVLRTGLPENTIRFYESRGLVSPATQQRNGRTYHEFTEENVADLKQIILLRKARFSLEEIQTMQSSPEQIKTIVTKNLLRLSAEKQNLERLMQSDHLKDASDWCDLSRRVEQSFRAIPDFEISLRFGTEDEESQAEKQAAIAAYRNKAATRENLWLYIFMGLSAFFLCMAVIFGALLYHTSRSEPTTNVIEIYKEVPTPSGTTHGWVYYKLDECIARWNGRSEEIIYQSNTDHKCIQFIVDEEKLYILDDTRLFSVNADGSGLYEYPAEILPEYANSGYNDLIYDIFLLDKNNIYVMQQGHASETALVQIPKDGGAQHRLEIDLNQLDNICGWIWDDILYVYGVDTSTVFTDEPQSVAYGECYSVVTTYNLTQNQRIQTVGGAFITSCATGLYFNDRLGYFCNTNSTGGESYELIRVTPENPNGEIVGRYPDRILAVYKNWVLLEEQLEGITMNIYLENIDTGARKDLGPNIDTNLNFTSIGLRVGIGQFVPYP